MLQKIAEARAPAGVFFEAERVEQRAYCVQQHLHHMLQLASQRQPGYIAQQGMRDSSAECSIQHLTQHPLASLPARVLQRASTQ